MKINPELEKQILATPGVKVTAVAAIRTPTLPLTSTEGEFQAAVIDLAQRQGWLVAHFRGVRVLRKDGSSYWQTPVQADGTGWPDLFMVRGSRIVVAELKSEKGRLTKEQREWLDCFRRFQGVEVFVWRPRDWQEIEQTLGGIHAQA